VHVTVEDGAGKQVSDAQVRVTLTMPAMPEMKMPEMKNSADLPWTGSDYSAPVQVTMAGGWNVEVEAKRGSEVLGKYETRFEAK
jgi:nitrogen fixation protein FixH